MEEDFIRIRDSIIKKYKFQHADEEAVIAKCNLKFQLLANKLVELENPQGFINTIVRNACNSVYRDLVRHRITLSLDSENWITDCQRWESTFIQKSSSRLIGTEDIELRIILEDIHKELSPTHKIIFEGIYLGESGKEIRDKIKENNTGASSRTEVWYELVELRKIVKEKLYGTPSTAEVL